MGSRLSTSTSPASTSTKSDDFILKYNAFNNNIIDNASLVDQRRVIFVSFVGLFNTWRNCPSVVLYSSIFLVPLKEEWIYEPQKYATQIKLSCPSKILFYEDKEFVDLLKWKNSQGLVFWAMNDFENISENTDNNLVCKFWVDFNEKLQNLYDPITGGKYNSIPFKKDWWANVYNKTPEHLSKFEVNLPSILCELYFVQYYVKFRAIKEILYQSNPLSLNPVIAYNDYDWMYTTLSLHIKKVSSEKLWRIDECKENEEGDTGEWCIVGSDCLYGSNEPSIDENIF
eukprot:400142_1